LGFGQGHRIEAYSLQEIDRFQRFGQSGNQTAVYRGRDSALLFFDLSDDRRVNMHETRQLYLFQASRLARISDDFPVTRHGEQRRTFF
jgi:hypothetical protein